MRGKAVSLSAAVERRPGGDLPDIFIFNYTPASAEADSGWETRKHGFRAWFDAKGGKYVALESYSSVADFASHAENQISAWLERAGAVPADLPPPAAPPLSATAEVVQPPQRPRAKSKTKKQLRQFRWTEQVQNTEPSAAGATAAAVPEVTTPIIAAPPESEAEPVMQAEDASVVLPDHFDAPPPQAPGLEDERRELSTAESPSVKTDSATLEDFSYAAPPGEASASSDLSAGQAAPDAEAPAVLQQAAAAIESEEAASVHDDQRGALVPDESSPPAEHMTPAVAATEIVAQETVVPEVAAEVIDAKHPEFPVARAAPLDRNQLLQPSQSPLEDSAEPAVNLLWEGRPATVKRRLGAPSRKPGGKSAMVLGSGILALLLLIFIAWRWHVAIVQRDDAAHRAAAAADKAEQLVFELSNNPEGKGAAPDDAAKAIRDQAEQLQNLLLAAAGTSPAVRQGEANGLLSSAEELIKAEKLEDALTATLKARQIFQSLASAEPCQPRLAGWAIRQQCQGRRGSRC